MSPQNDWTARFTAGVAAEVQRHRKLRGWSAQRLADECAALGLDLPRSTLADLENGRRASLSVAELAVIARALEVPPLLLMYPVGYAKETEALPGVTRPPFPCARWFAGEAPFPGEDDEDYLTSIAGDWIDSSGSPLGLYRANERALLEEAETMRQAESIGQQAATATGRDRRNALGAAAGAMLEAVATYRTAREGLRRKAEGLGLLPPRKRPGEV